MSPGFKSKIKISAFLLTCCSRNFIFDRAFGLNVSLGRTFSSFNPEFLINILAMESGKFETEFFCSAAQS